jgi:hypothetical protein
MVPELTHTQGVIEQKSGSRICGEANNGLAGLNMFKTDY